MRKLLTFCTILTALALRAQVPCDVTLTIQPVSCAGADDGGLTVVTNSGGPFTYAWDFDPMETGASVTDLAGGFYSVIVDDGLGCFSEIDTFLVEPGITISGTTDYCPNDPPVLTADPVGGFQPIGWLWSTLDTLPVINIPVGTEGAIDLAAVDADGCVAQASVNLVMLPTPIVSFVTPDSTCQDAPTLVQTFVTTADSLVWRWGGSGFSNLRDPLISFGNSGWQPVSLQGFDTFGCGGVPVLDSIFVIAKNPAIFTAVQIPCTSLVDIVLSSTSDSCAFFINDSLYYGDCSGYYRHDFQRYTLDTLTFYTTQPSGCDDTLTVVLDVRTEPTLFLANAFTPNNDGINDLWPTRVDFPDTAYELRLFDRWGEEIWFTTDPQEQWDGNLSGGQAPMGVYVYSVKRRDPCSPTNELKNYGHLTVFR